MNFTAPGEIFGGHALQTFAPLTNQTGTPYKLGQTAYDVYGRRYRFFLCGATNTVAGTLYSAPTMNGSQIALAVANTSGTTNAVSGAIGTNTINVVPGAAIVANQYLGGTLIISASLGIGRSYRLSSHAAGNSTVNITFTLDSGETGGFDVSANSSTVVDLVANPYNAVVVSPTTAISQVVGAAINVVVNGQYGWLATNGEFPVLCDSGAPAIYTPVAASAITAGDVGTQTGNATVSLLPAVGYMVEAGVSAKAKLVYLEIN